MQQPKPFKISASVTDFLPLFSPLEPLFKGLKLAGVDSIEMVIGVKSRWSPSYILSLSKEYDLPITTVHQPAWSGLGVYIDNTFVELAKKLGASDIVFHPLPFFSYNSKIMRNYFKKIAFLQKAHGINIMLENMSKMKEFKVAGRTYLNEKTGMHDMNNLLKVAEEYDFKLTYDVSHGRYIKPHEQVWFEKVFPRLHNIHISSFTLKQEHLPLFMGDFDTASFLRHLSDKKYAGHLTFEIFYPWFVSLRKYDYSIIQKSVEIIKSIV